MKPPGETKYTGPCVHQFGRDVERQVKKLKKEDPSAQDTLRVMFDDGRTSYVDITSDEQKKTDGFNQAYWRSLTELTNLGCVSRCDDKRRIRFTLTPLGNAAIEMEGQ